MPLTLMWNCVTEGAPSPIHGSWSLLIRRQLEGRADSSCITSLTHQSNPTGTAAGVSGLSSTRRITRGQRLPLTQLRHWFTDRSAGAASKLLDLLRVVGSREKSG